MRDRILIVVASVTVLLTTTGRPSSHPPIPCSPRPSAAQS